MTQEATKPTTQDERRVTQEKVTDLTEPPKTTVTGESGCLAEPKLIATGEAAKLLVPPPKIATRTVSKVPQDSGGMGLGVTAQVSVKPKMAEPTITRADAVSLPTVRI